MVESGSRDLIAHTHSRTLPLPAVDPLKEDDVERFCLIATAGFSWHSRDLTMPWTKGKSRNLAPAKIPQARTLVEALRRALNQGYLHPKIGVLSYRKLAEYFAVSPKTIQNWLKIEDLPPEWALPKMRAILKDFH